MQLDGLRTMSTLLGEKLGERAGMEVCSEGPLKTVRLLESFLVPNLLGDILFNTAILGLRRAILSLGGSNVRYHEYETIASLITTTTSRVISASDFGLDVKSRSDAAQGRRVTPCTLFGHNSAIEWIACRAPTLTERLG